MEKKGKERDERNEKENKCQNKTVISAVVQTHTEKMVCCEREEGKGNEREGLCLERNDIPRNDEEEEGMEWNDVVCKFEGGGLV